MDVIIKTSPVILIIFLAFAFFLNCILHNTMPVQVNINCKDVSKYEHLNIDFTRGVTQKNFSDYLFTIFLDENGSSIEKRSVGSVYSG